MFLSSEYLLASSYIQSNKIRIKLPKILRGGDVYFVPAFSGLYAPHWDASARGVIAGLTRFASKGHIARAAIEAICEAVAACELPGVDMLAHEPG